MSFDDLLDDRQPDARARVLLTAVQTLERIEDAVEVFLVESHAIVADAQAPFPGGLIFSIDANVWQFALLVEFHRVAQQVLQQLADLRRVALDGRQWLALDMRAAALQSALQILQYLVEHSIQLEVDERLAARGNPRVGQQVADQRLHAGSRRTHAHQVVATLLVEGAGTGLQAFGKGLDLAQWLLQVVGGDEGELLQLAVAALQLGEDVPVLDGNRGQVAGGRHQFLQFGIHPQLAALVDGEGAEQGAVASQQGSGPAGVQPLFGRQLVQALPAPVAGDVGDQHRLTQEGSAAAGTHALADAQALHGLVVALAQAGRGTDGQALAAVVDQQHRADHPWVALLHQQADFAQDLLQRLQRRDHGHDPPLCGVVLLLFQQALCLALGTPGQALADHQEKAQGQAAEQDETRQVLARRIDVVTVEVGAQGPGGGLRQAERLRADRHDAVW
ncbi:hypothetical protein D3C78_818280 [compost metagenome]